MSTPFDHIRCTDPEYLADQLLDLWKAIDNFETRIADLEKEVAFHVHQCK